MLRLPNFRGHSGPWNLVNVAFCVTSIAGPKAHFDQATQFTVAQRVYKYSKHYTLTLRLNAATFSVQKRDNTDVAGNQIIQSANTGDAVEASALTIWSACRTQGIAAGLCAGGGGGEDRDNYVRLAPCGLQKCRVHT